jgi:hypothetical protein
MRQARDASADILAAACGWEPCRRCAVAAFQPGGIPAEPALMNPASPLAPLLLILLLVLVPAAAGAVAPPPGVAAWPAATAQGDRGRSAVRAPGPHR